MTRLCGELSWLGAAKQCECKREEHATTGEKGAHVCWCGRKWHAPTEAS